MSVLTAHTPRISASDKERHKSNVLFSKVNNYIEHRRFSKSTRFAIPANSERAQNIYQDLYDLSQNGFSCYKIPESEVWCERYDEKHPLHIFTNMESGELNL